MDEQLLKAIEVELSDDLDRYSGDYDVWSDIVLDYPSLTLLDLLNKIPRELTDVYYKKIDEMIEALDPAK